MIFTPVMDVDTLVAQLAGFTLVTLIAGAVVKLLLKALAKVLPDASVTALTGMITLYRVLNIQG